MASIRFCLLCAAFIAASSTSYAAEVTLAWDPNHEAGLTGYGIYYKQGSDGPPYDLFGFVGKTELGDSSSPTFTLTGLNKNAGYYFAVTAFDSRDNESAYSAAVCAQIGDTVTPCGGSTDSKNSGSGTSASTPTSSVTPPAYSGSSSGGGGGCFLQSVLP
jgi:hypothetical protein